MSEERFNLFWSQWSGCPRCRMDHKTAVSNAWYTQENHYHDLKSELTKLTRKLEIYKAALEQYADGRAFDFDRAIRGEVMFNASLSSATARQAIQEAEGVG